MLSLAYFHSPLLPLIGRSCLAAYRLSSIDRLPSTVGDQLLTLSLLQLGPCGFRRVSSPYLLPRAKNGVKRMWSCLDCCNMESNLHSGKRFCFWLCRLASATPESLHRLTLPPGKIVSGKTAVALPTDKNRRRKVLLDFFLIRGVRWRRHMFASPRWGAARDGGARHELLPRMVELGRRRWRSSGASYTDSGSRAVVKKKGRGGAREIVPTTIDDAPVIDGWRRPVAKLHLNVVKLPAVLISFGGRRSGRIEQWR